MNNTAPVDTNVRIPAAVRAAAARSDAILNQMQAEQQVEAPQEPVTSESNFDLTTQEATEAPAPVATEAPSDDGQSWEHKYKSVHGRYVRAQEQIKTLGEQIQGLQNVIATLQAQPQQTYVPELSAERLITSEEENDYGTDFLNVVGKKAREELAPVIKGYEAKINQLEAQLKGVHGQVSVSAQEKMFARMDDNLPEWRDLNRNEEFLNWLALPDTYSGVIRHELLKGAFAGNDASRVLTFFKGFLAEEAAVAPSDGGPDYRGTTVPKVPLESLAAPGRAKSAAASAPTEKPIFTRSQIAAFYAEVASGKFRGRDADKAKKESQIFEAQRDGRIR
ncbi:hypothetical protein UFOVP55_69 [uncultured Caudovirales phage]|uniref:Uncharacterized protein n=1 Tax=uncultured Caudovirales phage TaxID=2100421 RepID=A0A6J5KWA2_9CAUD|nr:hypothetical protein UFOVP55_69 [uncultured Caudovirales phage]